MLLFKNVTPDWSKAQIWVKSTKTNEARLLIDNGTDARYVANGFLVFARLGKLFAVGFDLKTQSLKGQPVQVLDGVTHATYEYSAQYTTGAAQFSVSRDGTLLYAPGSTEPSSPYSLKWVDRKGVQSPVGTRPMSHLSARISPDGKDILFNDYYPPSADLWIYDTVRGIQSRQNLEGQNAFALWTPDGASITFRSDRSGPTAIYQKKVNSSTVIQLTSGSRDTPSSWSPDGRQLAFIRPAAQGAANNIFILDMNGDKPKDVHPLQVSKFAQAHAEFSPDGKWIAYDETEGTPQVYVQAYPAPGDRVQISTDSGTEPAWSKDGKELFYISNQKMMSVGYKIVKGQFIPDKPVALFDGVEARQPARAATTSPPMADS